MADSNITKRALAASVKKLMEEIPFEKISIADICERCNMNRKSFYYHFRDKYDLINWIYDVEFLRISKPNAFSEQWMMALCNYLYENRTFYRKALKIKGQNSFRDHFTEMTTPAIEEYVRKSVTASFPEDYFIHAINFVSDAFLDSIVRWISDINCEEPEQFLKKLKFCVRLVANSSAKINE
ncbi:MAG: TetR/AcrR family transcriptional regulator C-terminal domain-containing protein [Sphaerochaeta sp.]